MRLFTNYGNGFMYLALIKLLFNSYLINTAFPNIP